MIHLKKITKKLNKYIENRNNNNNNKKINK